MGEPNATFGDLVISAVTGEGIDRLVNTLAVIVRDARSALAAARGRVTLTRREESLAREMADIERRRFDQGDSTLLFVNLREQVSAEASMRVTDALLDSQRSAAAWSFATATDARSARESCRE